MINLKELFHYYRRHPKRLFDLNYEEFVYYYTLYIEQINESK